MSYIRKHWRGDLPFAVSFWINFVLLNIIIQLVVSRIVTAIPSLNPVTAARLAITFASVFVFIVYPWQVVGAWRAAQRHRDVRRKHLLARTVQVILVASVVWISVSLIRQWPTYREFLKIGFAENERTAYRIELVDGGMFVRIQGRLEFGATDEIEELLTKNTDVIGLILESEGGRTYEGRSLAKLVYRKNLETRTFSHCYSACTVAFVAGISRSIGKDARLGFHRYAVMEDASSEKKARVHRLQQKDLEAFRQQGVSEDFIDRILATPHDEIWFPSTDELLEAGVVQEVLVASDDERLHKLDAFLAGNAVIQEIRKLDPNLFSQARESIRQDVLGTSDLGLYQQVIGEFVDAVMLESLPRTSDAALLRYTKENIRLLRLLNARNPRACIQYLRPETFGEMRVADYVSDDYLASYFETLAIVVREKYSEPTVPVDQDKAMELILELATDMGEVARYLRMSQAIGEDELFNACEAHALFYEKILAQNSSVAANTLRFVFGGG